MTLPAVESVELVLPERLLSTLTQYAQQESLSLDQVMQIALHDFLVRQSYSFEPHKRLRITPAEQGSGIADTSINHDDAVLISKLEWDAIQESLYLTSIPELVESIEKAANESVEDCIELKDLDW